MEIATFYLQLPLSFNHTLSLSIGCLCFRKIPLIYSVFDSLSMEFGRLSPLMGAFQSISQENFTELSLIIAKFGSCYSRKHGPRYSRHIKAFTQGIIKKVLLP